MALHIVLLGHSFVRRISEFTREPQTIRHFPKMKDRACFLPNWFFDPQVAQVRCIGWGGSTIATPHKNLWHRVRDIERQRPIPDLVCIQVGANDIGKASPEEIVAEIEVLVKHLFSLGVHQVNVGLLCPRFHRALHRCPDFNHLADHVNFLLKRMCSTDTRLRYILHKGTKHSKRNLVIEDGCHWNDYGSMLFFRSWQREMANFVAARNGGHF